MPGFSGLASADFEGFLHTSCKRCRPRLFFTRAAQACEAHGTTVSAIERAIVCEKCPDLVDLRQPISRGFCTQAASGAAPGFFLRALRKPAKPMEQLYRPSNGL